MSNRDNIFDLIRHAAACLVLFSHHFALSGYAEPIFLHWDTFGFVSVATFFAISGYFMPQSFNHSENFVVYLTKRCCRIFPGLIACSFFMCYVIGPIFTPVPVIDYVLDPHILKTSISYSFFIGRSIPDVFSDFIYKGAINGSLWTLPVEFLSYIILGIILSYSNTWKSVFILLLAAMISTFLISAHRIEDIAFYGIPLSYLSMFGIAFSVGALMSMTYQSWINIRGPLVLVSIILILILQDRPELSILGTASLAVLAVILGVSFRDKLINGRFDISYGIYIYAFPIQQMVINRVTQHFWLSLFISIILTGIMATFSYLFIEKPFLYANIKSKKMEPKDVLKPSLNMKV